MPADTYTPLLGLLLQGTGNNNNTWGDNANTYVTEYIESAIAETQAISTTGGSTTLSAAEARSAFLNVTGTLTSDATLVVPNLSKSWLIYNGTSGAYGMLVKTASGASINVPAGVITQVWCFGANVVRRSDAELVGTIVEHAGLTAPAHSFEMTGAVKAVASYPDLFAKLVIQQSGAHTNGSAVITGLSDTSSMKAGYYVGGTGISDGSTIVSVDSASQITINNTCSGSATTTVYVSPYGTVNSSSFTLPNVYTAGRYLRSRTSAVPVGTPQADQNKQHNHTATATTSTSASTGVESADHTHYTSGTTSGQSNTHTHTYNKTEAASQYVYGTGWVTVGFGSEPGTQTGNASADHSHTWGATSGGRSAAHTHTVTASSSTSVTVNNDGGTEARPVSLVVMFCIRY